MSHPEKERNTFVQLFFLSSSGLIGSRPEPVGEDGTFPNFNESEVVKVPSL